MPDRVEHLQRWFADEHALEISPITAGKVLEAAAGAPQWPFEIGGRDRASGQLRTVSIASGMDILDAAGS